MKCFFTTAFSLLLLVCNAQTPLRLAIAGLSHGHVGWVFNRPEKKDIELVGIYETDQALIDRFVNRYKLDKKLFFRLNRQIIANINAIREFKSIEFSKIELSLVKNNYIKDTVIVRQFTAPEFKSWINNL